MSFITNILWVLIYFAPTIVAWKWDASKTKPAWVVFLVNLTLGWTVIGWFIAWGMVLIDWRKMLIERYGRRPAGAGEAYQPPAETFGHSGTAQRTCGACGGGRAQPCPQCRGSRGTWIQPTTEHGTAQWQGCGYCTQAGTVTCGSCGGTGVANF